MDKDRWVHIKDFQFFYTQMKKDIEELRKFYLSILSQYYFFFTLEAKEEKEKATTEVMKKNYEEIKRLRNRLCREMIKDFGLSYVKDLEEEFMTKTMEKMKELEKKASEEKKENE
jgi:hypothetical protein